MARQECDYYGGWSSMETLSTQTYGTLMGCINETAHLGCLIWNGNNSTPSGQTYTMTIADKYKPKGGTYMGVPMKNGLELAVQYQNGTVSSIARLATSFYSAGVLVYPLD